MLKWGNMRMNFYGIAGLLCGVVGANRFNPLRCCRVRAPRGGRIREYAAGFLFGGLKRG